MPCALPTTSDSIAPASPPPVATPVGLSARRLHDLALEAFRVGNRGRLSLCEALRVLGETRLHLDLGFPTLAAYASTFFQLRRSEAFEHVRVARALVELTELREAFGRGAVGWAVLKAITRVASVATQAAWIAFAGEHDVERTLAEARDALRRGRDVPRESSFGLPNLDQKLVLRFSRSDLDKVRTWIEGVCATVADRTGREEVSLEQALLFLCESGRVAQTAPAKERAAGSCGAQIVYQHCPDCRRARVATRDGFVEVAPEELERFEPCAEPVVIDGPTPAALRRRVLAREARRCGNPRCDNRADHCHHIVFRSRGGKTGIENEVAVCRTCHALIHAGLLRVRGDASGDLQWLPAGADDRSPGREVAADRAAADRLPVLQLVAGSAESADADSDGSPGSQSAGADSNGSAASRSADADSDASPPSQSADADSTAGGIDPAALAHGLTRLGVPLPRSRQMIRAAICAIPRGEITEAAVLRRALAMI